MNYRSVAKSTSTIFASAFVALATCSSALAAAGTCTLTIERNMNFNDVVTVTSDQSAVSDGVYPVGTEITLTATPAANGTFKKWYGDVAKEDRTKQTITFTLTEDRWIFARFVHQWTLSSDITTLKNGDITTMTDGRFKVNVTVENVDSHSLAVGRVDYDGWNPLAGATLLADGDTGSGVIDLGGTIMRDGDDAPWTITKFAAGKGSQTVYTNHTGTVTTYISPGTVTIGNASQLFHCGDPAVGKILYGVSYETIIIDEPELELFFREYMMGAESSCSRLICDLPKVRAAAEKQTQVFYNLKADKFKFDWWDLSSLSSMTNIFFAHTWGRYFDLYRRLPGKGTLTLPSMRGVDWVQGNGTQLFMMPNVECISLGGATYETTVTNLCTYAFAGNTKLKKLVLHAASDMRVGSRIFADHSWNEKKTSGGVDVTEEIDDDGVKYNIGSQKSEGRVPDVIHFTGQAISFVAISNLLDRVTSVDTAVKPVTILASKYQAGWGAGTRAEWISPATSEERAAYPGETVIGVYRENAAAPSGKAVVLHSANEWDEPSGLMMIFR